MTALGKSMAQIQAEQMASARFADMMAAAGVSSQQMSHQVLYMMPRDFLDKYMELFDAALTGHDGGADQAGKRAQSTGELARATGKATGKTGEIGLGSRGGKKYKKYWTVIDDDALDAKERIDKRLRGIARDIDGILVDLKDGVPAADRRRKVRAELDGAAVEETEWTAGRGKGKGSGGRVGQGCGECGRLLGNGWKYCASCGCPTSP